MFISKGNQNIYKKKRGKSGEKINGIGDAWNIRWLQIFYVL